jgi:polysaccharide biosynthesis/export protein
MVAIRLALAKPVFKRLDLIPGDVVGEEAAVTRFFSGAGLLVFCLVLAGCSLPRGAAFESEVLAVARNADGTEQVPDFAVEPVTRDRLAVYDAWPATGPAPLRWINRQPQAANRIIAPGDRVAVTVWNTEENSLLTNPGQRFVQLGQITVSPGGNIFLPYIENTRISGMSPDRAREVLQERFVEVIPSAQVQLELTEGRQSTVSLVGGVNSPGSYPMPDQDFTVMALLAEAGGVRSGMINPQIRLVRGDTLYGTSVARLFAEPTLDTTLVGGDKVLVEEETRSFLSLGATGREAVHIFPKDHLSALEAMAIVGGLLDTRANPQGILVLREYPATALRADGTGPRQTRTVFTLDLTSADGLFSAGRFQIRPGDLVYATESPVTTAQTLFGLVGGGFAVLNQAQR